jgi:hypothetical protein
MNLPAEIQLISADYLKKVTQVNGSVDDNFIRPFITTAQDLHLERYLGTDLMEYIKDNRTSLAGDYLELYQKHIVKVLAWWTVVELTPHLYVKLDNGTLVIRTSEETTPITENDFTRMVENSRQKATAYTDKMVRWLCNNRLDEYYTNTHEKQRPVRAVSRVNGLLTKQVEPLPRWQQP